MSQIDHEPMTGMRWESSYLHTVDGRLKSSNFGKLMEACRGFRQTSEVRAFKGGINSRWQNKMTANRFRGRGYGSRPCPPRTKSGYSTRAAKAPTARLLTTRP